MKVIDLLQRISDSEINIKLYTELWDEKGNFIDYQPIYIGSYSKLLLYEKIFHNYDVSYFSIRIWECHLRLEILVY